MAALNVEQTVLNQLSGSEQPLQEEVQLTELLPVKQSQIRENGIFEDENTDTDATDALKILRSFTNIDSCNDADRQRNLPLYGRFEHAEQGKQESEKQWRVDKVRKRIKERGKHAADSIEIVEGKEKQENRSLECESRMEKRKRKRAAMKSLIGSVGKSPRRRIIDTAENSEQEDEGYNGSDGGSRNRQTIKGNTFLDDSKEHYLSEGDESAEVATYLDLDKGNHLSDEIYVFDRDAIDGDTRQNEREAHSATTDGALLDGMTISSGTTIESIVKKMNKRVSVASTRKRCAFASRSTNSRSMFEDSPKKCKEKSERMAEGYSVESEGEGEKERESNRMLGSNCFKVNAGRTSSSFESGASSNVVIIVESSSSPSSSSSSSSFSSSSLRNGNGSGGEEEPGYVEGSPGNGVEGGQESQQKKYCCVVCEARFKGSGGLRNHYKIVHGAGPIFKCDECGKEFPLKERLKLHVRTHTGFKPYKCPECDKSFARGGQLVQHRRTHSQVKPYRCGLCSGTFTCAANLALHVKRHNGQKDHKCDICGRAFVRRDALKKHLECLHRDVKSFLCVICNKTFKGHLPQHMRTHARDRPHGCATCGQRFAQKSQLTVHQRTHSGQRPFRCLVCWQAFAHSTALKLHTRRHTGERPFKCAECNAGFTQLPHWKKHMKCIHGRNEPYACKKCKSFFRIKNDLECHEKTCHPELASAPDVSNSLASTKTTTTTTTTTLGPLPTSTPATLQTMVSPFPNEIIPDKATPPTSKYRVMTVEKMRLLLAVLLKRISKQERLDELGFGKRLIDEVLHDSLISAGKNPVPSNGLSELEILTKNLEIFLKWTVPKEHWENFRRLHKTPEDILETLTAT